MNPPSIILGGGVHGKACWLIAYRDWHATGKCKEIDKRLINVKIDFLISASKINILFVINIRWHYFIKLIKYLLLCFSVLLILSNKQLPDRPIINWVCTHFLQFFCIMNILYIIISDRYFCEIIYLSECITRSYITRRVLIFFLKIF